MRLLVNSTWLTDIQKISLLATVTCSKVCTMVLALFLVMGVLMIIPAIIQNVSLYVWDIQVKQHETGVLGKDEKYLFIYRLICYVGALLTLGCSTLPTLLTIIARQIQEIGHLENDVTGGRLEHTWGLCHVLSYLDLASRLFVTYILVIPIVEFFAIYCYESLTRRKANVNNIFAVIVYSTLPIGLFALTSVALIIPFTFQKQFLPRINRSICNLGDYYLLYYYFDFLINHTLPCILLIVVIPAFCRHIKHDQAGILYEPLIFLICSLPLLITQTIWDIHRYLDRLQDLHTTHFANAHLAALTIYHASFSAMFLVFTLKSVVMEIRDERQQKRRASRLRRRRMSHPELLRRGLHRQYSVALNRFPEEENQIHAVDECFRTIEKHGKIISALSASRTDCEESVKNYKVLFAAANHEYFDDIVEENSE